MFLGPCVSEHPAFFGLLQLMFMLEICGYFKLQICQNSGVKSVTYRGINPHVCVHTAPDNVAYPIEPSRYVLGRVTSAFSTGAPEPNVTIT